MAQPDQIGRLFLYVAAQLSCKVINEKDKQEIKNWPQSKQKFKAYYGYVKDLTQLHEELETIKQKSNESIIDFYKRSTSP